MINQTAYNLGANRSVIRDLFEYGRARAAIVGEENIFDFTLGNPSIPAPAGVNDTIRQLLNDTDSLALHGYTSAVGDSEENSIGIIGGADGPTAIFVTGNWGGLIASAAAILCAGIAVIVALKKRKK